MEKEQEREWEEAQKIVVSIDLVTAAKNQVKFLAAVDRNRYLYAGPAMNWAIHRYNTCWLPLLAKHLETPLSDDPIVVPLDCEWIWHCHRLNPVRYKFDCVKLFGRVLGNHNIISSVQGTSKSKTEEIWNTMFPEEPYELDPSRDFPDVLQKDAQSENITSYDLVSAVGRQDSFYYQVSRPHVFDDLFLEEALARYKGFLHLIRTNKKMNKPLFCVPTYDIDLMWHSHQLHPISYCNDLIKLIGHVLQHDDTDSDRSKGKKLDTGFTGTTSQWKETFGLNYWKAGAMSRRDTPTPVANVPFPFTYEGKIHTPNTYDNLISPSKKEVVEVLLEFAELKNLPKAHQGNVYVSFSKKQPDILFRDKKAMTILSEAGEKQVASFQCEPTGEFLFELMYYPPSDKQLPKSFKSIGSCKFSFEECFASKSQLFINKWLTVEPKPEIISSQPILLHVSLSITPPTPAPQVFFLLQSQSSFKETRSFPIPMLKDVKHAKNCDLCVMDSEGKNVLNLQMRNYNKDNKSTKGLLKEVIHITDSGETHTLAELEENEWVIKGSHGSMKLRCTSESDGHFLELVGEKMVRLFAGRKLDYEPNNYEKNRSEQDFMTAIEFSAEHPYGKAIALLDFKHGIFEVMDEWMIPIGITLSFILYDVLRTKARFTSKEGCKRNMPNLETNSPNLIEKMKEIHVVEVEKDAKQGFSQSGLGNGYGNVVDDGGCNRENVCCYEDMINIFRRGLISFQAADYSAQCIGCAGRCGTPVVSEPESPINFQMAEYSAQCIGCAGRCGTPVVSEPESPINFQMAEYSAQCIGCAGRCGTPVVSEPESPINFQMAEYSAQCIGCAGRCGTPVVSEPELPINHQMADYSSQCMGCVGRCRTQVECEPESHIYFQMAKCSGPCNGCGCLCRTQVECEPESHIYFQMAKCSGPCIGCGGLCRTQVECEPESPIYFQMAKCSGKCSGPCIGCGSLCSALSEMEENSSQCIGCAGRCGTPSQLEAQTCV